MKPDPGLHSETATARSPLAGGSLDIELRELKPDQRQFERINRIVAEAIATWDLPERVKRMSLPLYRYHASDLQHMRFVIAESRELDDIFGLAAIEDADPAEGPEREALLLHGIYVDPRHHRQGVGAMLFAAAERVAAADGASGMLVKAQADAVPFFEACGYGKLPILDPVRDYAHRYWKALRTPAR